ncbi:hypothetical protein SLA2020_428310 [Shorea laevis]
MGDRLLGVALAKQIVCRSALAASRAASTSLDVPEASLPFMLERSKAKICGSRVLLKPAFISRFAKVGFNHPTGGLTIPCRVDTFIDVTSRLTSS